MVEIWLSHRVCNEPVFHENLSARCLRIRLNAYLEHVAHHQNQRKFKTGQDDYHVPELLKQLYVLNPRTQLQKIERKEGTTKSGSKRGMVTVMIDCG
jgi:hypothetical protein